MNEGGDSSHSECVTASRQQRAVVILAPQSGLIRYQSVSCPCWFCERLLSPPAEKVAQMTCLLALWEPLSVLEQARDTVQFRSRQSSLLSDGAAEFEFKPGQLWRKNV